MKHHHACSAEETFLQDFSSNSEAFASELLENLEEMSPCYWYKLMEHMTVVTSITHL